MKKEVVEKTENNGEVSIWFFCPGCKTKHRVIVKGGSILWEWNNDLIKPTFAPSVLCTWDVGEEHKPKRCHSFVREGKIQFLNDCTHKLKGQTIDLKEIKD